LFRKWTISSLAYYLFYIENKANDPLHVAPGKVHDPLINILCDECVVGGYTCAHSHGDVDSNFIINQHLEKVSVPLSSRAFPSFTATNTFDKKMSKVIGLDIRAQYAYSSTLPLPYGVPLLLSTINVPSMKKKSLIDVKGFCNAVQTNPTNLSVQTINIVDRMFKEEYYSVREFMRSRVLEEEVKQNRYEVIKCYSNYSPTGQINIRHFFVDAYILLKKKHHKKIILFQYNGYTHGCRPSCRVKDAFTTENMQRRKVSYDKHETLLKLVNIWKRNSKNLEIEVIVKYPCDYLHTSNHHQDKLLVDAIPQQQSYQTFLEKVYANEYQGFLVVKNLQLQPQNSIPSMGFCVQRSEIDPKTMFTPHMKNTYHSVSKSSIAVVGLNNFKGIKVIHSSYFLFLKETFGFVENPLILHAVLYQHASFLKKEIDYQLQLRSDIKTKLKNPLLSSEERQILESSSSRAKLQINSSYGFTLLKQGKNLLIVYENN
jgi:hypothetical protein